MEEYEYENKCDENVCEDDYLHDMREARCTNMNNRSIINAFKTELDCFSRGTQNSFMGTIFHVFSITVILLYSKGI